MKTTSIAAISSLLSIVSAVPLQHNHHPRDVVWHTETTVDWKTVDITTTVWVQPGGSQTASAADFTPSSSAAAVQTSAAASSYVAPASSALASSYVMPSSSAVQTSSYVAPSSSSTYVAPSSSYVAPSSSVVSSAAAASSSASSSGDSTSAPAGVTSHTGDITHYDIGTGSCGWTNSDSEAVVALPTGVMDNGADPNSNPLCGKTVSISYQGKTTTAKIVDTCPSCDDSSIDLSPTLFTTVAPSGDGRVHDVTWWINSS